MSMHLYLAHADTHEPVLAEGIPFSAALAAPASPRARPKGGGRGDPMEPPDDLARQRWAVIAPEGEVGDRLLELIEPLRQRRKEQQDGVEPLVYRVPPNMGPDAVTAWLEGEYWDRVGREPEALPRYLLVLGDPQLVSWDLQQLAAADSYVGRLAFDADEDYEAYVAKVLQWERAAPEEEARAIFYAAHDGTPAMLEGYEHLLRPSIERARRRKAEGHFAASEIVEIGAGETRRPTADQLSARGALVLEEAARARAGLLFTVSHGAGAPCEGWRSAADQRAYQGAMVLNRGGERLTAEDVRSRTFLPGGAWFFFACFGAGTPKQSAYHYWLNELHRIGLSNSADDVLSTLPKENEPPFVAALPKAALANPSGPLAVLGHVDLAWSWSFLEYDLSPAPGPPRSRVERFDGMLRALVNGHRVGFAHHALARSFRSLNTGLSSLNSVRLRDNIDNSTKARQAGLWMQREDLGAHVLLGDPAARLAVKKLPDGVRLSSPASTAADRSATEAAVMAVLRGAEPKSAIAARYGITEAELERSVSVFMSAGRAALKSAK